MRELTLDRLPKKVLAKLDLETAFRASRCVLAAEKLLIFRKLHGKELSAAQIGKRVGIHPKHCEPFLDFLVFLGLLNRRRSLYRNSALAEKHFIRARSIGWTRLWSQECIDSYEALSVLDDVLTTGRDWRKILGKERKPDYERLREDPQWARGFTYALYDLYKPDAETLAKHLDLSGFHSLLDVGGGSGVMSFALVRANPRLRACVLELPFVCDAATEIIRKERLSRRVRAMAGDMNRAIPEGFDVVMFWNIGVIDSRVMRLAYESLPDGGMIVRSCSSSRRSRKPSPSAFVHGYLSVQPKQQTKAEKMRELKDAGFRSLNYRRISPNLGFITGLRKPRK